MRKAADGERELANVSWVSSSSPLTVKLGAALAYDPKRIWEFDAERMDLKCHFKVMGLMA
ncbi:MAG TPA: hypothetical protein VHE81_03430 [Lacipirellulaceae bacterium]|nr:hypothetical protein [Lacipirellulaceae bacterium]